MAGEGLTVYAHLSPGSTDRVTVQLIREGLWDWGEMVYDWDTSLLMTTTSKAKDVVMAVLEKLALLPEGETVLRPTT